MLAFALIFVLLMSTACTNTNKKENSVSIDDTTQAEQANNNKTQQNTQTTILDNQGKVSENKNETSKIPEQQPEDDSPSLVYNDKNATPVSSFEYFVNNDKKGVGIKNFIGTEKDVVIPNYIDGCPVTRISVIAFGNNEQIESVVIPENIEYIYDHAFAGCRNLKTIEIKSKNLVIDYEVFRGCTALENLTLSEGVTKIGSGCFRRCEGLKELHIPSTLNDYGFGAFGGIYIEKLTFADGIETVGSGECFMPSFGEHTEKSYKTVTIPASVKTLITLSFGKNLQEIIFLGDAPKFEGNEQLFMGNPVIKYKKGTKGWDAPQFKSYTLVEIE